MQALSAKKFHIVREGQEGSEMVLHSLAIQETDEPIRGYDFIIDLNKGLVHMDGYPALVVGIVDFVLELFFIVGLEGLGGAFAGGDLQHLGEGILFTCAVLDLEHYE
jgi:hypothetical protein